MNRFAPRFAAWLVCLLIGTSVLAQDETQARPADEVAGEVREVTPAEYLRSRPQPVFAEDHKLLPLSIAPGWANTVPFELRKELAENWGYGLFFGKVTASNVDAALNDPDSIYYQVLELAKSDPDRYPLDVILGTQNYFRGKNIQPGTEDLDGDGIIDGPFLRDADGELVDGKLTASPEIPDEQWDTVVEDLVRPAPPAHGRRRAIQRHPALERVVPPRLGLGPQGPRPGPPRRRGQGGDGRPRQRHRRGHAPRLQQVEPVPPRPPGLLRGQARRRRQAGRPQSQQLQLVQPHRRHELRPLRRVRRLDVLHVRRRRRGGHPRLPRCEPLPPRQRPHPQHRQDRQPDQRPALRRHRRQGRRAPVRQAAQPVVALGPRGHVPRLRALPRLRQVPLRPRTGRAHRLPHARRRDQERATTATT